MLTLGQTFFVITAAVVLVGPKDIPRIARMLGFYSGRAVGFLMVARQQATEVVGKTDVQAVRPRSSHGSHALVTATQQVR